jgi:hypothetical protein
MKKPWSLSTTVRNPERLRDLLIVLQQLEGQEWNKDNQNKYQTLLIQNRLYGYGSPQFYNGLTQKHIEIIDDASKPLSFKISQEIFESKNYKDSSMRGRQSINPLKKFGLVQTNNKKVSTTDLGRLFLKDNFDYEEIFFKTFLKWQLPNPDSNDYKLKDGYNIKPFIGVLHLINKVNQKSQKLGEKAKGISKQEFSLFCPLLVNYKDIESYADKILSLRKQIQGKKPKAQKTIFENYRKQFALEFTSNETKDIETFLKNLKDYGDNAIRYFRLTRFLYIRGNGFYVDLEPRRAVEIENLLKFDDASSKEFKNKAEYLNYISNIVEPQLPWESQNELVKIIKNLLQDITEYETKLNEAPQEIKQYNSFDENNLKKYITELRTYRRALQNKENHQKSQKIEQVQDYISQLQKIFDYDDRPILLEKLLSLGLNALNDAITIKPNYPVGDDNEPTFTAPANTPDIECYYEKFNAICEVTMLNGRDQWYNEGQPVMRHLRDFEDKNQSKPSYCLFVAPKLHRDTANTFWTAIKYEYEGRKQNIIPLTIGNFITLLKALVKFKTAGKFLKHDEILSLYDNIIQNSQSCSNANDWLETIPNTINSWEQNLSVNYC